MFTRTLQFQFQLDSIDHRTILLAFRRTLLLFLFSSSILISSSVHGYTTRSYIFIYATCSQEKYQPNTPFEPNLNSLLSSIVTSSSDVSYNSFSIVNNNGTSSSTPLLEGSIYGLYQCRGDLDPIECSKCVQNSVNQIGLVCPYSLSASLQLEGCYIRYEHFDFLGKLDTSLRYKKCNKNVVSNDVEFLRRRDDVLGDLQARRNSDFRVSNSGLVEGYAQCLGDLSAENCNSCMAEAVMKLTRFCGSAVSGDVFLGQCYARYWKSGHYNDDEPDSSNEDQVGKSIAIIVGVVLGLAILVVVLSICKNAMVKRIH
ncbi:hypothetical protein HN51_023037 [Arachis hypogaea]|uniref:Gnk2-homologous domain-containing protein n=1 Tax=Arachis hypogaea TaxID=3818 RepID=A0A445E6S1_ARAHY|nr:plasmodesmata-located protein 8-like [Arachis hypogaea]RYR71150.1 hypothetical protein Ahy_A02g005449 [Arachis hypogaea]